MTAAGVAARGPGLIDVHAHFVTESYVQLATAAGHGRPDGMDRWPEWSVEGHLELMDRHDIETALVSVSSPGVHFGDDAAARLLAREVNEFAAGLVADHPGRFGFFASLPLPDVDGALRELDYALGDLAADGVALMTNAHGRYLGDEAFEPLFAELDSRGSLAFIHPTSPAGWEESALGRPRPMIEYVFDTARTLTDMLASGVLHRHPDLAVIVPHCGGAIPVLADRVNEFLGLFLGTDEIDTPDPISQLQQLFYDMAGPAFPRQVPSLLGLVKADRLLFGSDYCWTPPSVVSAHLAQIDAAVPPASAATWRSLTTGNAQKLLRLPGPTVRQRQDG